MQAAEAHGVDSVEVQSTKQMNKFHLDGHDLYITGYPNK